MGLLFWKDNAKIDAFAHTIADELFSYVSPDMAGKAIHGGADVPKKQARKIEQKFGDVVLQIKRFSESNSLGVYGRARLQQKFNDRLEELGYSGSIVKRISEIILTQNTG